MSADLKLPQGDSDEDESKRPDPFPYSESEDIFLPEDYSPTKHDVINGRGRKSYNHIANRRFRHLISMNLERYLAARCKVDKTLVVVGIVDTIRNAKPAGGFLKRCPKTARWISMSDESAREKVGHCLRDMIASQRDDKKGKNAAAKKQGKAAARAQQQQGSSPMWKQRKSKAENIMLNMKNPWQPRDYRDTPKSGGGGNLDPAAFAMWSALHAPDVGKGHNAPPPSSRQQPPIPTMLLNNRSSGKNNNKGADPPSVPMSLNNLDTVSLQKGTLQDMSEQQRRILNKLESGWKGSVEELMEAVK